jgi:acyl transferase domain-containing protein
MLALKRAYEKAGVSPTTVGLFEAHGTGTVVGDRTEALALSAVLEEAGAPARSAAIGSVKSMIGHTKATAGVAGLAKVALALYHKVLPPTLGVTQPNPKARFGEGPLYVNSETRPWMHADRTQPRRAGVNAFGFGGTNFHAILEEYTGEFLPREAAVQRRPSELCVFAAPSSAELADALESLEKALAGGARPELRDLAYTLWQLVAERSVAPTGRLSRLAIVASSLEDLQQKLGHALKALAGDAGLPLQDPRGIYFSEQPLATEGKVAFLFPGQGSQYPNMLRDLAVEFPEVRKTLESADRVLEGRFPRPLSSYVFPPPAFTPDEERAQQEALTDTHVAQPALGAANMALLSLLRSLGVHADIVGGHSYGEYAALCAAGAFDEEALALVSEERGRAIVEAASDDLGTMAAVDAAAEQVSRVVGSLDQVWIANLNSPEQTIISGSHAGVERTLQRLKEEGLRARRLAVACAFHSPLMAPARERLARYLNTMTFAPPQVTIFSNTTAAPYPQGPREIAALLGDHLGQPVRFADEVEAMYQSGARVFVEVGPRNVLVGLVRQTLGERAHAAIALDVPGRPGLTQLHHALGQLTVHGVPLRLDRLFQGRAVRRLDLAALVDGTREKPPSPTTWLVSGGGIRPAHQPADLAPRVPQALPRPAAPRGNGNGLDMTHDTPAVVHPAAAAATAAPTRANGTAAPATVSALEPAALPPFAAAPAVREGAEQAIVQFQALMGRFLETQKSVMLAYLQGTPATLATATLPVSVPASAPPPTIAAAPTPVPAPAFVDPPTEPAPAPLTPAIDPQAGPPDAPTGARHDRAQLTEKLLQIVGDRTGYPPDMLDLDVDIEADLGIDSIKRVEILGTVQRACIPADRPLGEKVMEQLTGLKTLRGIVDWLDKALGAEGAEPQPAKAETPRPEAAAVSAASTVPPEARREDPPAVPRSVVALLDAPPLGDQAAHFAPDRVVLVTDDERGVAQRVCEELQRQGARVALLKHRKASENGHGEPAYRADLTDAAAVEPLLDLIRRDHGPIGGLVHLLPLASCTDFEAMDLRAWRAALARDVKSLFYLAREAARDLKHSGNGHANRLLAATTLGTARGAAQGGHVFLPGHGGVGGMVKSLAHEWPGVECKVVGLDPAEPASVQASQVLRELAAGDGLVELAYEGSRRRVLQPSLAPLDAAAPARLDIQADWVILVTGGARGITAEVACHLAERYRPTLVLVGRSPLPDAAESPATRELSSPQALKAALLGLMRQTGQSVTVSQVEAAYQRVLKDREMRAALARIERTGAPVRYHQADVRDETRMRSVIEAIYREHGRLDGVIHGAGVIEDKLVEDKTTDSFDRVFDTKAESAFVLSRLLRPESLRFLAFFGSAAGSFGNRGQADYAAANEILSKLALWLKRSWPGRVVSISWGPWLKTGMVSPEMQREFARRGVDLISIPAGCRLFDQEIRHGDDGDAEVIVAGGAWSAAPAPKPASRGRALPLLEGATFTTGGHVIEAVRTFDPAVDLYLLDHQIDGSPVLPLAAATELMAEVAQRSWPDLEVVGVRELQLFKGVVFDKGPRAVRVVARAAAEPPHDRAGVDVNLELRDAAGSGQPLYRATVELGSALSEAPLYAPPAGVILRPFPMSAAEAYRQWLFHGPRLQAITDIEGVAERDIRATLDASAPPSALRQPPEGQWVIDPVMFDSGLQLFLLWARAQLDRTLLPSRFQRYRRYGSLSGSDVQCHVHVLERSRDPLYYVNIAFVGPDGRLLGLLEEIEGASSRALNRLSAAPAVLRVPAGVLRESPSL